MRRLRRSSALWGAAAVLLAGCGDIANMLAPAGKGVARPASISFRASVTTSTAHTSADVVALRVTSSYVAGDGSRTVMGSQTLPLQSDGSQAVPVPIDLASCLADPAREGTGTECSVVLELALVVNGSVLDRQTIGPIRLAPGGRTDIAEPVALFEIAAIALSQTAPLSLVIGTTSTVIPTVRDARGSTVLGRTVSWSSDDPTVATVDNTGRITAVKLGQTRITAAVGGIQSSVALTVIKAPVALSIAAPLVGSGAGSVRSTPAGIDCRVVGTTLSGVCSFNFAADAQVALTSTPDAGTVFGTWGGACVGNAIGQTCTVALTQPVIASAQFAAQRRVTIASAGNDGKGRVTGAFGVDCRVDGSATTGVCTADVPDGTPLVLTALADGASGNNVAQVVAPWAGECSSTSGATCTVTPNGSARTVRAGFFGGRRLQVLLSGDGSGSVSASGGLSCARSGNATTGTCELTVAYGTAVQLTGNAGNNSALAWGGVCTGADPTCNVTMTEARTISAAFSRTTIPLTLVLAGSGNGSVLVNGVLACARTEAQIAPVTCIKQMENGATAVITSPVGDQTEWLGYSGVCDGLVACSVSMTQPQTLTSTFRTRPLVGIAVSGLLNGTGVVRSTETTPLIDCRIVEGQPTGPRCTATVPSGTSVRLQATGDANFALTRWGGACLNRTSYECVITTNSAATEVSAAFEPAFDLEMRVSGTGVGAVTFDLVGAPSQKSCELAALVGFTTCRFALPVGLSGVFRGTNPLTTRFDGFVGPCAESLSAAPVQQCTYRGIGFLRTFTATFTAN